MWILNMKVKVILEVAICSTIQVLVLSSMYTYTAIIMPTD